MRTVLAFISALSCLTFVFVTSADSAVTLASDDAANSPYANGWQSGDNGGSGFGPWTFAYSGVTTGLFHAPQFIDRAPLVGNSLGAPAFGLTTSDRDFAGDTSEALRSFSSPLGVGQTFSIDVDGSALDPAARKFTTGNTLQLFGSDGRERFGLFTNNDYHNNNWTATGDVNTSIPASSSFHIDLKLVTANTYDLAILPIGGGTPLFTQTGAALTGTAGAAISRLRISAYGTGSSATGVKELFFDNLMVIGPGVLGDYNKDGTVDAADYVIWRNTLGQTGAGLAADGNGNSLIDSGDFSVWKANFGSSTSRSGSIPTVVPEPATSFMAVVGMTFFAIFYAVTGGGSELRPTNRHGFLPYGQEPRAFLRGIVAWAVHIR